MNVFIYVNKKDNIDNQKFEVVETKGKGHPDNICDTLAEKISANYSKYCINKYGVILRHMIDKLSNILKEDNAYEPIEEIDTKKGG